jgi:hypothetical protein
MRRIDMGRMTIGTVAVAAAAAIAASCGGGGGGSGTTLSKEDFIAQADAICTKHDAEFTNEIQPTLPNVDPTAPSTSDEDLKKFEDPLDATHDLRGRQVDELRALTPPEEFQEQWDSVLSFLDASVEALGRAADAVGEADREAMAAAFADGQEGSDEADRIAKDYGFKVCGQS